MIFNELTFETFEKLRQWVDNDPAKRRSIKVDVEYDVVSHEVQTKVFAWSSRVGNGIYVTSDMDIENLEEIIRKKEYQLAHDKIKHYEELKGRLNDD